MKNIPVAVSDNHCFESFCPPSVVPLIRFLPAVPGSYGNQPRHSHKVVCCSGKQCLQLSPRSAPESALPQSADSLEPPQKNFFDFLPDPLTNLVSFMAGCSAVNRRAAALLSIGCYTYGQIFLSYASKQHPPAP